jgi:hypothetical protein
MKAMPELFAPKNIVSLELTRGCHGSGSSDPKCGRRVAGFSCTTAETRLDIPFSFAAETRLTSVLHNTFHWFFGQALTSQASVFFQNPRSARPNHAPAQGHNYVLAPAGHSPTRALYLVPGTYCEASLVRFSKLSSTRLDSYVIKR